MSVTNLVNKVAERTGGQLEALLVVGNLYVRVRLLDIRQAWARTDVRVEPVSGAGDQWVSLDRLRRADHPSQSLIVA